MWKPSSLAIIAALSLIHPDLTKAAERPHADVVAHEPNRAPDQFAASMAAAMHKMHEDMSAAPTTGDPDRDFLAMMIPHHAGAVEMARLLLMHGRDPLVRQLAEEIIAAQQTEIAAMEARLQILAHGKDADPGGFPAISGTRGEAAPH